MAILTDDQVRQRTVAELIQLIEEWGVERNIPQSASFSSQLLKLNEEIGELCEGKLRVSKDEIIDGLGDAFVCVVQLARMASLDLSRVPYSDAPPGWSSFDTSYLKFGACLGKLVTWARKDKTLEARLELINMATELNAMALLSGTNMHEILCAAYNEIKHRRGVMHNGVFIKSTDPEYAGIKESLGFSQ
jgi:NTP pyrophosphatase (non-canonical NTP hydrolase)